MLLIDDAHTHYMAKGYYLLATVVKRHTIKVLNGFPVEPVKLESIVLGQIAGLHDRA